MPENNEKADDQQEGQDGNNKDMLTQSKAQLSNAFARSTRSIKNIVYQTQ